MNQRSLLRLLFMPSFLSGLAVGAAAAAVLLYDAWLLISNNHSYYNYIFGPYGLKEFVWQSSASFSGWQQLFLASKVSYYVVLLAAAAAVGMATFTFLQTTGVIVRGSVELLETTLDKRPTQRNARREILSRFALRIVSLSGWAAYTAAFVSMLLPFCIVLSQFGVDEIRMGTFTGVAASLLAFGLLVVTFHLHVIFMRLVALRPRVFGGENDIVAAEAAGR